MKISTTYEHAPTLKQTKSFLVSRGKWKGKELEMMRRKISYTHARAHLQNFGNKTQLSYELFMFNVFRHCRSIRKILNVFISSSQPPQAPQPL